MANIEKGVDEQTPVKICISLKNEAKKMKVNTKEFTKILVTLQNMRRKWPITVQTFLCLFLRSL